MSSEDKTAFGKNLEERLGEQNVELRGHYPKLKVLFYIIETDFDSGKATLWYGPEQMKLGTCDLAADDVMNLLIKWNSRIVDRPYRDVEFLHILYDVYRKIPERVKEDTAAIPDIINEFVARKIYGKSKKDNRVLLSFDLHQLRGREINGVELSLVAATRAYTQRASDFIWVPTNLKGDGMYISHIRFKKPVTYAGIKKEIEEKIDGMVEKQMLGKNVPTMGQVE